MAYISTERVSRIREELKLEFPTSEGWKLSVRQEDHTSLCVHIMSAPFDFELGDHKQVNHFYLEDYTHCATFKRIKLIAFGERYFFNLEIGKWDKPFVLSTKKVTKNVVEKKVEKVVAVEERTYTQEEVEFLLKQQRDHSSFALGLSSAGMVYPRDFDKLKNIIDHSSIIVDETIKYLY